jgi:hypothetical protein
MEPFIVPMFDSGSSCNMRYVQWLCDEAHNMVRTSLRQPAENSRDHVWNGLLHRSEGFSSAKVLAKKMIAIMELSQQQLSKQVSEWACEYAATHALFFLCRQPCMPL